MASPNMALFELGNSTLLATVTVGGPTNLDAFPPDTDYNSRYSAHLSSPVPVVAGGTYVVVALYTEAGYLPDGGTIPTDYVNWQGSIDATGLPPHPDPGLEFVGHWRAGDTSGLVEVPADGTTPVTDIEGTAPASPAESWQANYIPDSLQPDGDVGHGSFEINHYADTHFFKIVQGEGFWREDASDTGTWMWDWAGDWNQTELAGRAKPLTFFLVLAPHRSSLLGGWTR
jgi:hypothetical protein